MFERGFGVLDWAIDGLIIIIVVGVLLQFVSSFKGIINKIDDDRNCK